MLSSLCLALAEYVGLNERDISGHNRFAIMGDESMSTFNIGNQKAGRDINYVAGAMFKSEGDMNITYKYSSASDAQKVIETLKNKINELSIDAKNKKNIGTHLESVTERLNDENIDKKSIADSMKKTNEILKEANVASENLKEIGVLIGKIATWLGPYAHDVGLI